jgi:hypothetical protein
MVASDGEEKETIRPQFDRSIMIDFQGARITSDTGLLLLREIDEGFGILGPIESELEDTRSRVHSNPHPASDGSAERASVDIFCALIFFAEWPYEGRPRDLRGECAPKQSANLQLTAGLSWRDSNG